MKQTPILFTSVLAWKIFHGYKTNTLRLVKPQDLLDRVTRVSAAYLCPYGAPGDLLWVKESHYGWGFWRYAGTDDKGKERKEFVYAGQEKEWRFTEPPDLATGETLGWHKRPSLFMPREFTRSLLELLNVEVIQLGEVDDNLARAEGMESDQPLEELKTLFREINGGWDPKTWVWSLNFKRLA